MPHISYAKASEKDILKRKITVTERVFFLVRFFFFPLFV